MKKMKLIALIAAGILFGSLAHAQEPLTLQQAIQFSLENKAEAKKAKLDVENSEYQVDEVRAGALPQIDGNAQLTYNPMIQENAITMTAEDGSVTTMIMQFGQPWQGTATLQLSQQIFNQSLFTGLKAAKTTREFYQINNTLTDEQLIEKVANAYYEVYQSQLQLETLESNLENTTKTRDVLSGMVEAGLMKKIDLDRTEVAINNLLAQKQQLVNAVELRENALKFAIGMEITQEIEMPKETFDIDHGLLGEQFNLNNRTEVLAMEKQIELLELNKKSVVADYYPSLAFTSNIGYTGFGQQIPLFNSNA
ncbi:MAG: TolC family protein, partial [Sphingobacterium sp.]